MSDQAEAAPAGHPTAEPLAGLTVQVAGAGSPSGTAVGGALERAGAKVVAVGRDAARLQASLVRLHDADLRPCDLSDADQVDALAGNLQETYGGIDGVVHLVGGWRGGGGIAGQREEDWQFLETGILHTLRNVSRSFSDHLEASPSGRLAIVSSPAVDNPTAGGAGYAAAKAAAEAWVQAVAQGFGRSQSGRRQDPVQQHSAAVVFVVKALVDEAMRAAEPDRNFGSYTDVETLADAAVALFTSDAASLNGRRIRLDPKP